MKWEGDRALTQGGDKCLLRPLFACVAVLLVITACVLHYLPRDFAMIVVTWSMLSVSVGIWFGHGVLNEP
jgi:hypothetical protein